MDHLLGDRKPRLSHQKYIWMYFVLFWCFVPGDTHNTRQGFLGELIRTGAVVMILSSACYLSGSRNISVATINDVWRRRKEASN